MSRFIYSLLYSLLLPLFVFRLMVRSLKAPAYRHRMLERFGVQRPTVGPCVWVHAVSVGEVIAISPLVQRLLNEKRRVLITTTTPTGADQVKQIFGDDVEHRFLPWDLPFFMQAFFRSHNPSVLVIVETEIWPNMLASCRKQGIPVLLANARLSEKSFAGYQRFASLTRGALRNITQVLAQHESDADRFKLLGAPDVQVIGSIKFDMTPDQHKVDVGRHWRQQWGVGRHVLIGASTHRGEDEQLLDCWRSLKRNGEDCVLILVPRHPERFNDVKRLAERYSDRVGVRSSDSPSLDIDVWIGDSLGEMFSYYAAADVAFVGGSFSGTGGHNPLEPAALGMPIVMGPSDYNFSSIVERLRDAGALIQVTSSDDLPSVVSTQFHSPMDDIGARGIDVVEQSRGALDRLTHALSAQLNDVDRITR